MARPDHHYIVLFVRSRHVDLAISTAVATDDFLRVCGGASTQWHGIEFALGIRVRINA
jgi:hypothetical protein